MVTLGPTMSEGLTGILIITTINTPNDTGYIHNQGTNKDTYPNAKLTEAASKDIVKSSQRWLTLTAMASPRLVDGFPAPRHA